MSERKQTPDILGDVLGGTPQPSRTPPDPKPASPKQARASQPKGASPARGRKMIPTQWEYKVVTFQNHRGWRPRFEDGKALDEWIDGPLLHEYLALMGEQSWELTTASSGEKVYGLQDKLQLYFKRPK